MPKFISDLIFRIFSVKKKKNYEYFIDYLYDDFKIKPLHIKVPKTKKLELKVKNNDLLEKHNTICDKISADIKN